MTVTLRREEKAIASRKKKVSRIRVNEHCVARR